MPQNPSNIRIAKPTMSSKNPSNVTGVDNSPPEKILEDAPSLEQTYMESGLSREDAAFLASFPDNLRTKCIRKVNTFLHLIYS